MRPMLGPPDAEGWRTVALRLEGEDVAAHQLTALGADVEVVSPSALRARLHAAGRAMAERNAAAPGAAGA